MEVTPIAQEPLRGWMEVVGRSALSSMETLWNTYAFTEDVIRRNIPGDLVECGVFAGAQCAVMARAILDDRRGGRRVHLFDSFAGIPAAGPYDREFLEARHPAGLSACSLDQVKANMAGWGIPEHLLVYHPGNFGDTIYPAISEGRIDKIAILRLDADLYSSTRVAAELLLPRVSAHGWIVCDDFDLSGARKAVVDCGRDHRFGPVYWMKQP